MADCPICDCCQCEDCVCSAGDLDFELTIGPSDLPCASCFTGPHSIPGSKTVGPCASAAALGGDPCVDKYDPNSYFRYSVTNNTNRCVILNFNFVIGGIDSLVCNVLGKFGCVGSAFDYGGNSIGAVGWFFICIGPYSTNSGCIGHRLGGCANPCCFKEATINGFEYYLSCYDETEDRCPPDPFYCNPDFGCPGCDDLNECPECCECCCIDDIDGAGFGCSGVNCPCSDPSNVFSALLYTPPMCPSAVIGNGHRCDGSCSVSMNLVSSVMTCDYQSDIYDSCENYNVDHCFGV